MWSIWTDGSSRGNPGKGGWGTIIASDSRVEEHGGREPMTTNNRMELTALIEGLRRIPRTDPVDIYVDSQYVKRGSSEWLSGWRRNGWKTAQKQPVENQDLWEAVAQILDERTGRAEFHYVPGHSGIPGNERTDTIATSYADDIPVDLYRNDRGGYPVDLSITGGTKSHQSSRSRGKPYSYVSSLNGKTMTHVSWKECEARVKGKRGAKYKKVFSKEEEEALFAEWSK